MQALLEMTAIPISEFKNMYKKALEDYVRTCCMLHCNHT